MRLLIKAICAVITIGLLILVFIKILELFFMAFAILTMLAFI